MAADTAAPPARYRVLRGIVHHPGGVARPGDTIALPPRDGDPLCAGPVAVLERLEESNAPAFDVRSDDALPGEVIDGHGLDPVEPEPTPTPRRRRKAPQ